MQTLYSLFFLGLGLSFQPLLESYKRFGYLVTHSWMKTLWEKVSTFDVKVVIADTDQQFPPEKDQFIMQALISRGYSRDMLKRINQVQVSQQVLYMSDLLMASGNKIDAKAWIPRNRTEQRSSHCWPNKRPAQLDFLAWRTALQATCPSQCKAMTVGKFIRTPHQIWD